MSETPTLNIPVAVWPILSCHDAHAEIRFLVEAFGFTASAVHSRADDPQVVEHAELR